MTQSVSALRRTPGFKVVKSALDTVYGRKGWTVSHIWPDGWQGGLARGSNSDDYCMAVSIDFLRVAYILVSNTYTHATYAAGPGGKISILIPMGVLSTIRPDGTIKRGSPRLPDQRPGDPVEWYAGTVREQKRCSWGADGNCLDDVVGLVRILKRWTDKQPGCVPATGEPPDVLNGSVAFQHVSQAFTTVFGEDGWQPVTVWRDAQRFPELASRSTDDDFDLTLTVDGLPRTVCVGSSTPPEVLRPNGSITLFASDPTRSSLMLPTGHYADRLTDYVRDKDSRFSLGIDRDDQESLTDYVRLLQQLIDQDNHPPAWKLRQP